MKPSESTEKEKDSLNILINSGNEFLGTNDMAPAENISGSLKNVLYRLNYKDFAENVWKNKGKKKHFLEENPESKDEGGYNNGT